MKTKIKLKIMSCLLLTFISSFIVLSVPLPSSDPTLPIIITQLPGMAEGTPRTLSNAHVDAVFDYGDYTVEVWLRNAGANVDIEIINTISESIYQYVVPGDWCGKLPIGNSSGNWTILFSLPDGRIFCGSFIIN